MDATNATQSSREWQPNGDGQSTGDWEHELASLLGELASVQSELLSVLEAKHVCLGRGDSQGTDALRPRVEQLLVRLQACHDRRGRLLEATVEREGPAASLGKLAMRVTTGHRDRLVKQVKEASQRMSRLQQESLGNWVLAQRRLLHVAQMLEVIATGGQLPPPSAKGESSTSDGALVDHAA